MAVTCKLNSPFSNYEGRKVHEGGKASILCFRSNLIFSGLRPFFSFLSLRSLRLLLFKITTDYQPLNAFVI